MASTCLLHLVVILLAFSQMVAMEGVPISRTSSLVDETQAEGLLTSENFQLQEVSEEAWGEKFMHGRMDLENNDYPGTGANNRHTPKPPHSEVSKETWEEEFMHGRMDLENNDYPGTGANNRHTPKPPPVSG